MKVHHLSKALASIVGILVLFSLIQIPLVRALNMNYADTTWEYLTLTGPYLTKPGNTEIYTISGKLIANMSGAVHIKLWLYNDLQYLKVLVDDDALLTGNYLSTSSFAKSYQVTIPDDADNNKYIYATVDAGTRHVTSFAITLVQNPTYAELQSQLSQAQAQVTNLTSQLNNLNSSLTQNFANQIADLNNQILLLQTINSSLQTQVKNLQKQNSDLQKQISYLQSNNTELRSEVEELLANITALQAEKDSALTQLSILQNSTSPPPEAGNFTEMQSVINRLSNQTTTLRAQLSEVDSQLSTKSIVMYVTTATAAALAAVTGVLIFRSKRKKVAAKSFR